MSYQPPPLHVGRFREHAERLLASAAEIARQIPEHADDVDYAVAAARAALEAAADDEDVQAAHEALVDPFDELDFFLADLSRRGGLRERTITAADAASATVALVSDARDRHSLRAAVDRAEVAVTAMRAAAAYASGLWTSDRQVASLRAEWLSRSVIETWRPMGARWRATPGLMRHERLEVEADLTRYWRLARAAVEVGEDAGRPLFEDGRLWPTRRGARPANDTRTVAENAA